MKPEAIFFDLDDTLVWLDLDAAVPRELAAWQIVAADLGIDAATLYAAHRAAVPGVWQAADQRILDQRQRIDGMDVMLETYRTGLRSLGIEDVAFAQRAFDAYWNNRAGLIKPFKETQQVLEALYGHCRLAVITNGPAVSQLDKLEINGLDTYFDLVIASGDVGYAKPDAEVFRIALRKLDVSPSAVWHVGDSPAMDVQGAHNARLTAVWLNRHGRPWDAIQSAPHHEIVSLTDLAALFSAG